MNPESPKIKSEKDILISYAHNDNKATSEDEGWISEFNEALDIMIRNYIAPLPVIWRDSKLQGNTNFDDEILSQIDGLKIMVSIISPSYLISKYCNKEIDVFIQNANRASGIELNHNSRLFKIMVSKMEVNDLPEPIRTTLWYEFFDFFQDTGKIKVYNKKFGETYEQKFWSKVDDVAQDIAPLIKKLRSFSTDNSTKIVISENADASKSEGASSETKSKLKIYLADVTSDLKEFYEKVKRDLKARGYTIFPEKNLTDDYADDLIKEVTAYLDECSLSIHLIGSRYGPKLEGPEKSVIDIQHELAAKQSATRGLKRLIWLSPDAEPVGEPLINFIDQLKTKKEWLTEMDWMDKSLPEFMGSVSDEIKKLEDKEKARLKAIEKEKIEKEKQATTTDTSNGITTKNIFLICHPQDKEDAKAVKAFLFKKGFDVQFPLFKGEPDEITKDREENLRLCDALILYYGSEDAFFRTNERALKNIQIIGRDKPPPVKVVIKAPPPDSDKSDYDSHVFKVINGTGGFNDQFFNDLLQELK